MRTRAKHRRAASLGLWLFVLAASLAGEGRAAQLLYVVNQDDASVEVIDTTTDALVAMLPVAKGPAIIAAAPNGRKLYITHPDAGKITVLDGASLTPQPITPTLSTPVDAAADTADGRTVRLAALCVLEVVRARVELLEDRA